MHPDRVYHVEHRVQIDGVWHYHVTDLIFVDGQPVAVLNWGGKPGKEFPRVSVPLDPAHLSEHRVGQITHRYDRPIETPSQ